jgi:hypothetical protein
MRRYPFFFCIALAALFASGCGSQQPQTEDQSSPKAGPGEGEKAAAGDTCPIEDPGPPPKCPEGCTWDGQKCRKDLGIIMPNAKDEDAGAPAQ